MNEHELITLNNPWVNRCIPRHGGRTFYNNRSLAALLNLILPKSHNLSPRNQTCAYSKERGQGWWYALNTVSRQSGRHPNSCSFIFTLVHDILIV